MRSEAKIMALCGILAALAVVIMAMGTLIPVATFVCPMLCMMVGRLVVAACGDRAAWAWYGAVTILGLLLAPDKEAAAVFAFLGYYPIVKPKLDRMKPAWLWKLLLFNGAILSMYALLIRVFGMAEISAEYEELGAAMTAVMLVLGNVTFFLLDMVLGKQWGRKRRG